MINLQLNLESILLILASVVSLIGSFLIIRLNWKSYGILFLGSGLVGIILCYIFCQIGFYSFPFRLFPNILPMPFEAISTTFPFLILLSVRFSPRSWSHKISFYMTIVHLGMLGETLALLKTDLIQYDWKWDFWDSYTWWWIYFLVFGWIGSLLIPQHLRKPIDAEAFGTGKWAWAIAHFIFVATIFLGGYYLGRVNQ